MTHLNPQYEKLSQNYIFPLVQQKMADFKRQSPDNPLANMGIGDIQLPLAPSIVRGIEEAAREMEKNLYGYGPAEGYSFLRERLAVFEYSAYGFSTGEIFVSEGINNAIAAFSELFPLDASVGILDPTYPVYYANNILAGRENIMLLPCTEENGFCPSPPENHLDIVYLTTPNNPTGIAFSKDALQEWVDWAIEHQSILLIDAAYKAFITSENCPKSIYEIPGADRVAVEFCSFSKSAGFTGLRVGYTIVPKKVSLQTKNGPLPIGKYWQIQQDTKTNGVSYVMQKAALAALSDEGLRETAEQVATYQKSTKMIYNALKAKGQICYGGMDSPYIWWKVPFGSDWDFFDFLLNTLHVVAVPGAGFGRSGEGFIRLSGFQSEESCKIALEHLEKIEETAR